MVDCGGVWLDRKLSVKLKQCSSSPGRSSGADPNGHGRLLHRPFGVDTTPVTTPAPSQVAASSSAT